MAPPPLKADYGFSPISVTSSYSGWLSLNRWSDPSLTARRAR